MILLRDDINEIIRILEEGGVVCYPTDTVWGIGCDAFNPEAVEKVSRIRGGAPPNGYIMLVDDLDRLKTCVTKVHPRIETLLAFHQRPLTIVYEKASERVPAQVKAPDGSVAIRIVQDAFCEMLIQKLGRPLLSTAACKAGEPYPPTFGAISSEILGEVDYVVKHRRDDKEPHELSSIARLDRFQELEFLRE